MILLNTLFTVYRKSLLLTCVLVFITMAALAQGSGALVTATGRVLDKNGEGIPGAVVKQEGANKFAITEAAGEFTIEVPQGAKLSVSAAGYGTQVLSTMGGYMNVQLDDAAVMLEEAVVVGYGSQRARDLTAPIAVVKGSELSKQTTTNAASALQGKVAGVQVINGGAPGAGAAIKIRGVGSIGDYAKPLYVVDGTFVENLDFLSSSDIESMNILKDASASAIYGVRAANGVVIVTTKKGMTGKPSITYDGYAGVQVPTNIMPLTNTSQYIELMNRANQDPYDPTQYIKGYTPMDPNAYKANTDWFKELTRNAFTQSHSIDVSGMTDVTNYSVGFNYFYQDGIMDIDNSYARYNLRGRFEQKVNKWLKVGVNTIISNSDKQAANEGALKSAYASPPLYPVYNDENSGAYPINFDSPARYGNAYKQGGYVNPVAAAYYYDKKEKAKKFVSSVFAEINIIDQKLTFRTSYNQDYTSTQIKDYRPEYRVGDNQYDKPSWLTETFENRSKQIFDNLLTYTDVLGAHNYSVMLGQSTRMEKMNNLWGSAKDVPGYDEQSKYLSTGSYKDRNANDGGEAFNGLSAFARATYSYSGKYLLSATFRADGSSKYQEKWGYFPSVGAGWVISQEGFMREQKVVDFLKLRASWGMLGNDNIPANSGVPTLNRNIGTSAVFGDNLVDGATVSAIVPNYLKWEVVSEWNVGVDLASLNNRLTGEVDFYRRVTDNVVFEAPNSGGTNVLSNNGKVLNMGVEVTVKWADQITDKLSYSIGVNATTIHNEVLELLGREYIPGASVAGGFATRTAVGHPIGSFYGYKVIGVFQKEDFTSPTQPIMLPGYLKFQDTNGDKKITEADKTYLGSPVPWLMGGIDLGLNYGNFDFSLALQGQLGNKVLNAKRLNRGALVAANYDLDFYENAWNGQGSSNTYPSAAAYNNSNVQNPNSFFVEDGSYFRIQNVQLGYTTSAIKFIPSLRVYVSAQRPLTIFGYNGFTPEVGGSPIATGIDNNVYPMQAIYSLGLKASF